LFASYAFDRGGVLHTVTARLDNVADKLYRNHRRSFRLVYTVGF
jgi:hypothetical protein